MANHGISPNPHHSPPRSVLHPQPPARFKSAVPPWSISIFYNQSPQPRESASGEGQMPVEMGVYSYFLIQGSFVSPIDPSLRYLCPSPAALSNPGCAFQGFSRLLPPRLAPCLLVAEASLPPASQNSRPAEALMDPSRWILSETNRFPRSLSALDLAGRPAAGPRAPQERRAGQWQRGSQEKSSF